MTLRLYLHQFIFPRPQPQPFTLINLELGGTGIDLIQYIISGLDSLTSSALQNSQELLITLSNAYYEKNKAEGLLSIAIIDIDEIYLVHTDATKI